MTRLQLGRIIALAALGVSAAWTASKPGKLAQTLAAGKTLEEKQDWDGALAMYEKALMGNESDIACQMAVYRARSHAANAHIENGVKLRDAGQFDEAATEFRRALELWPSSTRARQEIDATAAAKAKPATGAPPAAMQPVPELQPLGPERYTLKLVNQPAKTLFETIGKTASINVLFDPEFQNSKPMNVDLNDMTLGQALDHVALLTKSFWKATSRNTIFVTNDTPPKRRDYEDMVAQTFYLHNVNTAQELQEIITAVRTVAELQRVAPLTSQYAIVVRGEADRVALAGKVIRDLDKPRPEVMVDFLVMQAGKTFSRQLTAAIASSGLNVPLNFTPRSGLQVATSSSDSSSDSSSSSSTTSAISLASVGRLSSADFSMTLPSALLQAAMSDANTRILQSPQLRAIDNVKASLKIGERQPTASGSYSAGVGTTAVSALVNTQFTYIDVGVNIEMLARVHDHGEVSLHVEMDVSSVTGQVDLGGINEPIIGQRKIVHDIRVREGEVSLLGGLTQDSETKSLSGIPGLSSIPVLRRLFSGESVDKSHSELMIVLIPHVLRAPDAAAEGRGISVGNANNVKLNYSPTSR